MKIELFKWSVTLHFEDKTNIIMAIRVYSGFQSFVFAAFLFETLLFLKKPHLFCFFFFMLFAL